ncbi:unnamed protein product, partial [Pylaiella littoralis]
NPRHAINPGRLRLHVEESSTKEASLVVETGSRAARCFAP